MAKPCIECADRQWVGLTDEEIVELGVQEQFLLICDGWEELIDIARVIEAKLKEKNT